MELNLEDDEEDDNLYDEEFVVVALFLSLGCFLFLCKLQPCALVVCVSVSHSALL
jgi:hypothetical protein